MSSNVERIVDPALVRAVIRTAEARGQDVADLPLTVLAAAVGVSRSTLARRLGGSRRALDEAVLAAGVDPGGRPPVRQRAVEAAAQLIAEQGLAGATLEAVAAGAGCSLHSLYAAFGGRDGLLGAVYEKYTPLLDIEEVLAQPAGELCQTVAGIYRVFAAGMARAPRVETALLADAFARPEGPAARLVRRYFPWAMSIIGGWLMGEVAAGRIRRLPVELLVWQLLGPILLHLLSRPLLGESAGVESLDLDEVCASLGEAFVRAVGHPGRDLAPAPGAMGSQDTTVTREGHR